MIDAAQSDVSDGSGGPQSIARAKWGRALDGGYQIFPDVLLRVQHRLGLDAVDLAIILNIAMHWWTAEDLPYPRPSVIAKRIGVTTRTVERHLTDLQSRRLLTRRQPEKAKDGLTIRRFDLSGLVRLLEHFAIEGLALRNAAQAASARSAARAGRRVSA